jgi:sortase A
MAEFALLLVGLVCLGWFLFNIVDARIYQSYESYSLDAGLRGEEPTISGYFRHLISGGEQPAGVPEAPKPRYARRPPMATGSLIGRIEIPRIDVSTVVREGTDRKTLKRSAGHVPETALPGEHGNVGIAAHRDSFFRNLRNVREGDTIRMTTTWGVYEYEVDSLQIVFPKNIEVLDPTPAPSMTLVTCYPFNYVGSAPKRFIVRARQVNPPVEARAKAGA